MREAIANIQDMAARLISPEKSHAARTVVTDEIVMSASRIYERARKGDMESAQETMITLVGCCAIMAYLLHMELDVTFSERAQEFIENFERGWNQVE